MLVRLLIKNLVLVESSEVLFSEGFTVITGETGSGKSILLSSLNLLLGERQDSSLIRQGATSSIVEATFIEPKITPLLEEAGIQCDEHEVVIRRELLASGKSRAFVNDQSVQIAFLKKIAPFLIEVSAQHAHIELTEENAPQRILDAFAENGQLLSDFQKAYKELLSLQKTKEKFLEEEQARNRLIQTLEREIEEIETCNPLAGEDDALFQEYSELAKEKESSTQIGELLALLDNPEESPLAALGRAKSGFDKLASKNPRFCETKEAFSSAMSSLQDITFTLVQAYEKAQETEERFTTLDTRLKELFELKKKYGPTLADVLIYKDAQISKLNQIQSQNLTEYELIEKIRLQNRHVDELALSLTTKRRAAASCLSVSITKELVELNMPSALFEIVLEKEARTSLGDEKIHFYLTPNKGEMRILIQEAASGGELARLSLALKCVMMDKNPVGTILFDEIDANIGGETASIVGKKLAQLGKSCQVLAVTHFSQVARIADHHFAIQKREEENRTTSHIRPLTTEAMRHQELNRMQGNLALAAS